MPLSNLVFTPGATPNYAEMGFRAASLVPNLADQFNKGQDAAIKRQQDLLKYQMDKQKADLYAAIAPEIQNYQLAELQKKMQLLNGMAAPTMDPSGGIPRTPMAVRTAPGGGQTVPGSTVQQPGNINPPTDIGAIPFNQPLMSNPFGTSEGLFGPRREAQPFFGMPVTDNTGYSTGDDSEYYS